MCSQELIRRLLQPDHKVEDNSENGGGEDGDGEIDQGQSQGLNEGMVQGGLLMSGNDGTLRVESRNFSHRRQRRKQKSA